MIIRSSRMQRTYNIAVATESYLLRTSYSHSYRIFNHWLFLALSFFLFFFLFFFFFFSLYRFILVSFTRLHSFFVFLHFSVISLHDSFRFISRSFFLFLTKFLSSVHTAYMHAYVYPLRFSDYFPHFYRYRHVFNEKIQVIFHSSNHPSINWNFPTY